MQTGQCQLSTPAASLRGSDSENSDSDSLPATPPPLRSIGSSSSLYGTDIVEEDQRHTIKQLGEHIVHSK